jgi:hypothetical protein
MELGCVTLAEGAYDEAHDWLQQSIAACEQAGTPRISYRELLAAAYVARALDRPDQAGQPLCMALQMADKTGSHSVALQSLPAVALLLLDGTSGLGQCELG